MSGFRGQVQRVVAARDVSVPIAIAGTTSLDSIVAASFPPVSSREASGRGGKKPGVIREVAGGV